MTMPTTVLSLRGLLAAAALTLASAAAFGHAGEGAHGIDFDGRQSLALQP